MRSLWVLTPPQRPSSLRLCTVMRPFRVRALVPASSMTIVRQGNQPASLVLGWKVTRASTSMPTGQTE